MNENCKYETNQGLKQDEFICIRKNYFLEKHSY